MRTGLLAAVLTCAGTIASADFVSESEDAYDIDDGTTYTYGSACGEYDGQFYNIPYNVSNVRICGPGMDPRATDKTPDWENFDDNLALKDVYYNGTATLTARRTISLIACEKTWAAQTGASLAIGDMTALPSDPKSSRQEWDKNPFFFQFSSGNATKFVGDSDKFWYTDFQSSTSKFLWGQAWTLNSTKAGDGFDISGRYTTIKMNPVNRVLYESKDCISNVAAFIASDWDVQMTGHISPQSANLKIVMVTGDNDTTTIEFSGVQWSTGPKLIVTGSQIATEGMLEDSTSGAATVKSLGSISASILALLTLLLWLH